MDNIYTEKVINERFTYSETLKLSDDNETLANHLKEKEPDDFKVCYPRSIRCGMNLRERYIFLEEVLKAYKKASSNDPVIKFKVLKTEYELSNNPRLIIKIFDKLGIELK